MRDNAHSRQRHFADRHYPEEAPSQRVALGAFWIDATPVTNRQFGFKPTCVDLDQKRAAESR